MHSLEVWNIRTNQRVLDLPYDFVTAAFNVGDVLILENDYARVVARHHIIAVGRGVLTKVFVDNRTQLSGQLPQNGDPGGIPPVWPMTSRYESPT